MTVMRCWILRRHRFIMWRHISHFAYRTLTQREPDYGMLFWEMLASLTFHGESIAAKSNLHLIEKV